MTGRLRRLQKPGELSPDEQGGELNVVPFLDVIVNVLIFVLATLAVTFTATIEVRAPSLWGGFGRAEPALGLTVIVVRDGIALKAKGGNVAPGCEALGPGVAIPKRNAVHDLAALSDCAARLKMSSPEAGAETQAFVTANPDVDYKTIVAVVDALRTKPNGEPLFPDIGFRVTR